MAGETGDPDVLFELARDKLSVQLASADVVDGKIQTIFGISAGLMGLLAAVLAFKQNALQNWWVALFSSLGVICFVVIGFSAFGIGRGSDWEFGPELVPGQLARFLGDDRQNKVNAVRSLIKYYDMNLKTYKGRLDHLLFSTRTLAIQTVFLLAVAAKTAGLF
jgi:hypothetical protein